ncbi:MAG: hypothetical protein H6595_00230 [Flavobacteriales bacterium]|nr:hypothetical protein [Flavobacteriales bacterium]MCB9165886.1 hypothetical protein [Flavobacteriales bacterium]
MRVAIIDLGTNTFNLLVGERDAQGRLRVMHGEELPVLLGKSGIGRGMIAEDAFARGLDALAVYAEKARAWGASKVLGVGTSMLRNAVNGKDFVLQARERSGIPIDVISGSEEATMILDGVRQAVAFGDRPQLVMDIGGGSIEFMLATGKALMWKQSFEVGVTRLRERFLPTDPLTLDEELRIAAHLDERLGPLWTMIDRHAPHRLVGSAGSFDSLARIIANERGEGITEDATSLSFTAAEFQALGDRILRMGRNERLRLPGLPEHRADTIGLALIAIDRVVAAGGIRELTWSRYALKEGAAARALRIV